MITGGCMASSAKPRRPLYSTTLTPSPLPAPTLLFEGPHHDIARAQLGAQGSGEVGWDLRQNNAIAQLE